MKMIGSAYKKKKIKGVTLVELLVIISVLIMMVSLALPAVQSAREAARRVLCAKNLKEIMLSSHSFEAANGVLPRWATGKITKDKSINYCSIHAQLLPYMELGALHNAINFEIGCVNEKDLSADNRTAALVSVGTFICPSDSYAVKDSDSYGVNSYRSNIGTGGSTIISITGATVTILPNDNGAFAIKQNLRLSAFRDGLSNTLGFSEKPVGTGNFGSYNSFRDWVKERNAYDVFGQIAICSSIKDSDNGQFNSGRTWIIGGAVYTSFFSSVPPNSIIPDCGSLTNNGMGIFAARSYHPGGVNAAMADGSVRWFDSGIDSKIWNDLGTRSRSN